MMVSFAWDACLGFWYSLRLELCSAILRTWASSIGELGDWSLFIQQYIETVLKLTVELPLDVLVESFSLLNFALSMGETWRCGVIV